MTKHERAISYFSPENPEEFWYWNADATAIYWADESVVASRQDIVAILRRLEAGGLPSFGAIVQLVAACRGKQITVDWRTPSQDNLANQRVPCFIESGGQHLLQRQRVLMFSTPEAISAAVARLGQLMTELGEILGDPRALPELADILLSPPEKFVRSEGIVSLLAEGRLLEETSKQSRCGSKYPAVLSDVALLGKSLGTLAPDQLRTRLKAALESPDGPKIPIYSPPGPDKTLPDAAVDLFCQFEMPLAREWQEAVACPGGFCAASLAGEDSADRLVVARSTWDGMGQIVRWNTADSTQRVLLVPAGDERILVHQPSRPMLPDQMLPPLEGWFTKPAAIGCGGWLPTGTLQTAWNEHYVWVLDQRPARSETLWRRPGEGGYYNFDQRPPERVPTAGDRRNLTQFEPAIIEIRQSPSEVMLTRYDLGGRFWGGFSNPAMTAFINDSPSPIQLAAAGFLAALGIGQRLLICDSIEVLETYAFDDSIRKLAIGKAGSKTGVAISFARGVKLHWLGADDVLSVDAEINHPTVGFSRDGLLVVAGEGRGRVFEVGAHEVLATLSFDWPSDPPIAILPTFISGQFATLSRQGLVQVWRIR